MTSIVAVAGSPQPGGRTATAASGVLAGARAAGARVELLELATSDLPTAVDLIARADGVVFASPTYRASHSARLKELFEALERGMGSETTAPLAGKAAAIVMTGAAPAHFLAPRDLRNVLVDFFAVQVLSPALYLDHSGFVDRDQLTADATALAARHGAALSELTAAVRAGEVLGAMTPLV